MRLTAALLSPLLLGAVAARAEVVLFTSGHSLKVDSYSVEGSRVVLGVSGGEMIVSLSTIERIFDDEVASLPRAMARSRGPITFLDFKPSDPVPDTPFGPLIHEIASRFSVNPALLAAMIRVESNFDETAISDRGARGLLQLMPATARKFGVEPDQLLEPKVNLEAGVRYLNWLRKQFSDDLTLVLAGFSAGAAEVNRHGGVPPYRETQEFVARVYELLDLEP